MANNKKIGITADHAGYHLKEKVLNYLIKEGYNITDLGTFSSENVDYPEFGHKLAEAVSEGKYDIGISICGTGNGMNMTVNKHQGIRSALCWNEEISRLARAHNDANVCALAARFISEAEAYVIVKTFLETPFEEGRHRRRIDKIPLKTY